jgi:DNA-binding MarR family transcriptional regulator
MNNFYLEVISLVERLHRQFLEVVKLELEGLRIHDINNVQAMMLFNIGDAEMTVGELTLRGCYLGSNVSYNVKKMVENGYLAHERSVHDRRSIHVRLTEKGGKLRDRLDAMHQRHGQMLSQATLTADDLQNTSVTLRRLERFWIRAADLVQRTPPQFDANVAEPPLPERITTAMASARESPPETDWLFFGRSLSRSCHHRFGDEAGIAAYRVLNRLAHLGMLL